MTTQKAITETVQVILSAKPKFSGEDAELLHREWQVAALAEFCEVLGREFARIEQ
jgi:hypothetical protein